MWATRRASSRSPGPLRTDPLYLRTSISSTPFQLLINHPRFLTSFHFSPSQTAERMSSSVRGGSFGRDIALTILPLATLGQRRAHQFLILLIQPLSGLLDLDLALF